MSISQVLSSALAPVVAIVALQGCVRWNKTDTVMAGIGVAESAVDLYQTSRYIVPACDEQNPLIKKCGQGISPGIVIPVGALLSVAAAAVLPPKYRRYWLGAYIGIEGATIWSNHENGY
jgi:hypothetical protein